MTAPAHAEFAMLPTFPKIENLRGKTIVQMVERRASQLAPILGAVRRQVQFEGNQTSIVRHDDTTGNSPLNAITAQVGVSRLPLEDFDEKELNEQVENLAQQLAQKASAYFYTEIDKGIAEVGNTIDARGRPMSEELLLEAMEKMEHEFDENGTWKPPTFFASAQAIDGLVQAGRSGESGSEKFRQSLKVIIEKKRDDFRRREADRVLAG